MNPDYRAILSLIASGRVTAAQGERLLAIANERFETVWILALCLLAACLAQVHLHDLASGLVHFFNSQFPALADALSPITDLMGGLL